MSTEGKETQKPDEPAHRRSVEVKVVYREKYSVIEAHWDEFLHDVKLRSLEALEIPMHTDIEYRLRFEGHEVTDEAQSLIHLVKDRGRHQVDFHLEHLLTYFVNGESETTTRHELTVGEILETAGFTPITDYKFESEKPPHDYGTDYKAVVEIHQGQRFRAIFVGPTPTSSWIES